METTLKEISNCGPCYSYEKMNDYVKKYGANTPVTFKQILDEVGIRDATWCLRVLDYKDRCLFFADIAESVLPIFEKLYPHDIRPRQVIEGVRKYHAGEIDSIDLELLQIATVDAVATVADAAAASAAYAAAAAAAAAADADAADAADAYVAAADARKNKWLEIEKLFIKHFC